MAGIDQGNDKKAAAQAGGGMERTSYLWSTLYMCLISSSTLLE